MEKPLNRRQSTTKSRVAKIGTHFNCGERQSHYNSVIVIAVDCIRGTMNPKNFAAEAPGQCIAVSTPQGGRAWAFLPNDLPSDYGLSAKAQRLNERAAFALGGTNAIGTMLPNPTLLIGGFMRSEAISSTKIEGTRADFEDLLIDEAGVPGADEDLLSDVEEVQNYFEATRLGWLKPEKRQISSGYLRELHTILLSGVRGQDRSPGVFRDRLIHIGTRNQTLADARFVPPPPEHLPGLIENLVDNINASSLLPDLVRLAIIHYQFETIYPFSDGNGRLGRLMLPLLLKEWGHLAYSTLPVSEFFDRRRETYIDLLFAVSQRGVWDDWVCFVLEGIESQSNETVKRVRDLHALREKLRARYQATRVGKILTVIDALFERPSITVHQAAEVAGLKYSAAKSIVDTLVQDGVLVEWTGRQRDRAFIAVEIADAVLGRAPGSRPQPPQSPAARTSPLARQSA